MSPRCRLLASVISLCAVMRIGEVLGAPAAAPLPDGVAASGESLVGLYLRETTGQGSAFLSPEKAQALLDQLNGVCTAWKHRPARIVQGSLEDLARPHVGEHYFSDGKSASYVTGWTMSPDRDDPSGCDQRVYRVLVRTYTDYNGTSTTVTRIDPKGKVTTTTVPGRGYAKDLRVFNREAAATGSSTAFVAGAMDSVAGIPCRQWHVALRGTASELCVPEPKDYPEPLSRLSLKSKMTDQSGKIVESGEAGLVMLGIPIDRAVFDIPRSVEQTR